MRLRFLLAGLLLPALAHAQTACPPTDLACRVQHNDSAALGTKLDALHTDLQALLAQFKAAPVSTSPGTTPPVTTPPVTTPPTTTPPPPAPTGQVAALTVGPGQAIVEPADALGNVAPGGVLTVLPGTYRKTFMTGTPNLTIKCAQPMKCIMDGQGGFGAGHRMAWGKAFIVTTATLTVDGFKFINCGSPQSGNNYSNEAAIYLDDDQVAANVPTLTVRHSSFDNNANGLFANNYRGTVVIDEDVFGYAAPNGMNGVVIGTANGPAHDMYLGAAHIEVKGNYFYGSAAHNVKTRGPDTSVHDNPVMTYDGGRIVDLSDGGKLTFNNNGVWFRDDSTFPKRTIQSGLKAGVFGNSNVLGVGTENVNGGVPSGALTNSTWNIARTGSTIWVNGGGALTSSGNKVAFFGSGGLQVQGNLTGDISGGSAPPGSPAHAPAPPLPPSDWFSP